MSRFISWKIGVLFSFVFANLGHAQTRFEWPSKQTDVASYRLLDQCLGAVTRVRDSAEGVGVLKDTLPWAQSGPFGHSEPAAVNVAQHCIASIPLSSVTIDNIPLAQTILLIANRDSDIFPLYRKRLDAVSIDSQKIDVITKTIEALTSARPARLKLADSLLSDIQPYAGSWKFDSRMDVLGRLCRLAFFANEEGLVRKYCGGFSAAVDSLSDSEVQRYGMKLSIATLQVEQLYRSKELHDSLKVSSKTYVDLRREMITKAFRGWSGGPGIGSKAEPITGDYWAPDTARNVAFPRPGKITLVVAAPMQSEDRGSRFASLVYLRRLAQSFPSLEIVVMSGIVGYFGLLTPPPPAVETELLYKKLVDFHKIPLAGLGVIKQETWSLADPDRRRILDPYTYSDEYVKAYGGIIDGPQKSRLEGWGSPSYNGVLIDQDGMVVTNVSLNAEGIEVVLPIISILAARASK